MMTSDRIAELREITNNPRRAVVAVDRYQILDPEDLDAEWDEMLDEIVNLQQLLDAAQLSSIEGWNPGIDIERVKRIRRGEGWVTVPPA